MSLDVVRDFVGKISIGDKDSQKEILTAALCDTSVSITCDKARLTIHVPWTEVVEWVREMATNVQENT